MTLLRHRVRLAMCTLLALAGHAAMPSAQNPRPLPGSLLMGTVVDANTGDGLPRTIVTVERDGLTRSVVTDERGRYLFANLPAGRYAVMASRERYVLGRHGQQHAGGSDLRITMTAGLWLSDVDIRLWPPAVISGDVRTPLGDPIAAVTVTAYRRTVTPTTVRLSSAGSAETDDLGRYRIFGLVPGEYVVGASPSGMDLDELNGVFAPQLFPGAEESASAIAVDATSGVEFGAVNFVLPLHNGIEISGRVAPLASQDDDVLPTRVTIGAPRVLFTDTPLSHRRIAETRVDDDGRFMFPAVPPGTWEVEAHGPAGLNTRQLVHVSADPPEELQLQLQPPVNVEGQVTLRRRTQRPLDLSQPVTVTLQPLFDAELDMQLSKAVRPGDSFTIEGLLPGAYQVIVSSLPQGTTLEQLSANGVDVLDRPLEIDAVGTTIALHVTLGDTVTEVIGTVARRDIRSDVAALVIAFPADATLTGPHRRRSVRVGPDGAFVLFNLPPGSYIMAAVSGADEIGWESPEALGKWRQKGLVVTLKAAELRAVQVPVVAR